MPKIVLSIGFDADIATWLLSQDNRSKVVNSIMRGYLTARSTNTKEGINKRMGELKIEFEALKAKEMELIERG